MDTLPQVSPPGVAMTRPRVGIERLPTRRMSNEPRESMNCKSCRKRKVRAPSNPRPPQKNRAVNLDINSAVGVLTHGIPLHRSSATACALPVRPVRFSSVLAFMVSSECFADRDHLLTVPGGRGLDAVPKKRGPKTDVLEALLKRVDGLEAKLKEKAAEEKAADSTSSTTTLAGEPSSGSLATITTDRPGDGGEPRAKRLAVGPGRTSQGNESALYSPTSIR